MPTSAPGTAITNPSSKPGAELNRSAPPVGSPDPQSQSTEAQPRSNHHSSAAVSPSQIGMGVPQPQGHGARLRAAFDALEVFPALALSRERLIELTSLERPSASDIVGAVESDVALVIAVLRLANNDAAHRRSVETIVKAVDVIDSKRLSLLATQTNSFDFFERAKLWEFVPERFRLHAVAVQQAADRLGQLANYPERDRLLVTALLHDVGKLVLTYAYPGYPGQIHGAARTPEQRIHNERRELGVDHAIVGGVLARRWNLPRSISTAIEQHHSDDAGPEANYVRLADMLAHYWQGSAISPKALLTTAGKAGFPRSEIREVIYEMSFPTTQKQRTIEPCPLSARELDVLKRLGHGLVYKQIARDLGLSTSTVRTHLHNVYAKLGAVDRAQAVLVARGRGWI